MLKVRPDYYKDFFCIADKCRHNCCIGWAIEIDEETDTYYKCIENKDSPLSQRLKNSIDRSTDISCFITDSKKRCPFLNAQNLCDIIIEAGEEHICTICKEHPRFHNELPQRVESGLGMCCEEAARIILTIESPVTLIYEGTKECEDEIVDLRDEIIAILQNRSKCFEERIKDMLRLTEISLPEYTLSQYADIFLSLERLDDKWTQELNSLKEFCKTNSATAFSFSDTENDVMYEQLCVYLTYRHLANAPDLYEASLRSAFTALSYKLLRSLFVMHAESADSSTELFIELCRMYSCEIEYSDENLYILLDIIDESDP